MVIAILLLMFSILAPAAIGQSSPPSYLLTWLDQEPITAWHVRPRDINEAGVVVGWAEPDGETDRAFMFDNATGIAQDLNDVGEHWVDTITGDEVTGWTAWHANGINQSGQIVGVASHAGFEDRNFVLDITPDAGAPVFELLSGAGSLFVCINEFGDIAQGAKEINKWGVIISGDSAISVPDGSGGYTRYDFPGHFFTGINDLGMVTGHRDAKKGRNGWGNEGPILFDFPGTPGPEDLIVSGISTNWHGDVNNLGTVAFSENNQGFVDFAGSASPVNLDQLIVAQSQQDFDDWINSPGIFPTGINDAGQIIGQAQRIGWNGFILTPITNDPIPGITVTPTSGLVTTENGGTDSFEVVLDKRPSAAVTIGISSSNTNEGDVDKASLSFSQDTWDTPQTVMVTGIDDLIEDGDVAYSIVTSAAASTDPDYNGMDPDDVDVTNLDDEQAPTVTYDSTDTPTNIPDEGMADSTITINDNFQIANMIVTLNISHQRPSDLDVYLVGPNGMVQMSNVSGAYNVAGFNGTSTNGSWTLEIYDTRKKKDGDLNSWSITVETN